jgi:N-acetylmuramoyl-L-alanine amidase
MFRTAFIICGCLFILSGCVSNEEPTARIVYNPNTDLNHVRPAVIKPKPTPGNIIIHHSATNNGNAAIFDKQHREENHWEGVGYDFVIGNGTDSGDGQVEVTFRWRGQLTGAHCKTPNNWGNEKGIGICLVGNFDYTSPTVRQMQSLVKLVRFLQNQYRIPKSRIYGHGTTPGARVTDCPGRRFPMARLKSMLYN